jgi:tetratricopeptide (TPR) repeat protein
LFAVFGFQVFAIQHDQIFSPHGDAQKRALFYLRRGFLPSTPQARLLAQRYMSGMSRDSLLPSQEIHEFLMALRKERPSWILDTRKSSSPFELSRREFLRKASAAALAAVMPSLTTVACGIAAGQIARGKTRDARFYFDLGLSLDRRGDIPGAVAAFTKALALQPGWRAARFLRGAGYYRLNQFLWAIVDLRRGIGEGEKAWQIYSAIKAAYQSGTNEPIRFASANYQAGVDSFLEYLKSDSIAKAAREWNQITRGYRSQSGLPVPQTPVVGIIMDTGINPDVVRGRVWVAEKPSAGSWHGTRVARIFHELAPGVQIYSLRTGDDSLISEDKVSASLMKVAAFMEENPGVKVVVNISTAFKAGFLLQENMFVDALFFRLIHERGGVVVVSAGNDNLPFPNHPSVYPWTVSVAALDRTGRKARDSNYGHCVDLAAPGWAEGGREGASFAVSRVSGLIAQMTMSNPLLTPQQAYRIVEDTSKPIPDEYYRKGWLGKGVINPRDALRKARAFKKFSVLDPLGKAGRRSGASSPLAVKRIMERRGTSSFDFAQEASRSSPRSSSPAVEVPIISYVREIVFVPAGMAWIQVRCVDPRNMVFDLGGWLRELLRVMTSGSEFIFALWFIGKYFALWLKMTLKVVCDWVVLNVPEALKEVATEGARGNSDVRFAQSEPQSRRSFFLVGIPIGAKRTSEPSDSERREGQGIGNGNVDSPVGAVAQVSSSPLPLAFMGGKRLGMFFVKPLVNPGSDEGEIAEVFMGGNFFEGFDLPRVQAQGDELLLGPDEFRFDGFEIIQEFGDTVGFPEPAFLFEGFELRDTSPHRFLSPFIKLSFGFRHRPGSDDLRFVLTKIFEYDRQIAAAFGLSEGIISVLPAFQNERMAHEADFFHLFGFDTVPGDMLDIVVIPLQMFYSQFFTLASSVERNTKDVKNKLAGSSSLVGEKRREVGEGRGEMEDGPGFTPALWFDSYYCRLWEKMTRKVKIARDWIVLNVPEAFRKTGYSGQGIGYREDASRKLEDVDGQWSMVDGRISESNSPVGAVVQVSSSPVSDLGDETWRNYWAGRLAKRDQGSRDLAAKLASQILCSEDCSSLGPDQIEFRKFMESAVEADPGSPWQAVLARVGESEGRGAVVVRAHSAMPEMQFPANVFTVR